MVKKEPLASNLSLFSRKKDIFWLVWRPKKIVAQWAWLVADEKKLDWIDYFALVYTPNRSVPSRLGAIPKMVFRAKGIQCG